MLPPLQRLNLVMDGSFDKRKWELGIGINSLFRWNKLKSRVIIFRIMKIGKMTRDSFCEYRSRYSGILADMVSFFSVIQ